jgi:hypothetical protein
MIRISFIRRRSSRDCSGGGQGVGAGEGSGRSAKSR